MPDNPSTAVRSGDWLGEEPPRTLIPNAAGWWWGRMIGNEKWHRMKVVDGPDGLEVVQQATVTKGTLAPLRDHVCVEWGGRCAVNGASPSSVLRDRQPPP